MSNMTAGPSKDPENPGDGYFDPLDRHRTGLLSPDVPNLSLYVVHCCHSWSCKTVAPTYYITPLKSEGITTYKGRPVIVFCIAGKDTNLDPRTYYEPVQPSDWKPQDNDSCSALYRRAYCGYGDAAFPPLYFSVMGALCQWKLLPAWAILLAALPIFGIGVHFLVFKGILL